MLQLYGVPPAAGVVAWHATIAVMPAAIDNGCRISREVLHDTKLKRWDDHFYLLAIVLGASLSLSVLSLSLSRVGVGEDGSRS